MPRINAVVETKITDTFRVRQVDGLFDLPHAQKSVLHFEADLPGLTKEDQDWQIGAIVGPSGSGKSVLARQAYTQGDIAKGAMVQGFDWPADRAVVDGFDASLGGSAITRMLSAVGFSSPPAWLRPWRVLSNGEKFRCDLARALLLNRELVVVDEFTSVVDRQVARFGSAAIAKAIRSRERGGKGSTDKQRSAAGDCGVRCKRFVAVSCHYDILPWLSPDWYLDTATGQVHWGLVQRPAIELAVHRCHQSAWPMFARHHYLSSSLNAAARCYVALWQGRPVAFVATMHQSANTPRRRVHRLVVLPDYQGLSIGPKLLATVAQLESDEGKPVSIVTSHPVLVRHLNGSKNWRRTRTQKCGQVHSGFLKTLGRAMGSQGRATASYLFQPEHQTRQQCVTAAGKAESNLHDTNHDTDQVTETDRSAGQNEQAEHAANRHCSETSHARVGNAKVRSELSDHRRECQRQ